MAAKRKVDNLMALAVLATVVQRPMHRYETASPMRACGKDQDMDVKWGSLYTVVQNLAKHGFLEVVGTSRQGARPERTVFRITEASVFTGRCSTGPGNWCPHRSPSTPSSPPGSQCR